MKRGLAVALVLLPAVVAMAEAFAYYRHNATNRTVVSSGIEREYLLYVPATYDASKPTPLVISFHGAGMWAASQRDASEWNRVADKEGFVVAYPQGEAGGGPRVFHVGPGPQLAPDVRYVADMIDDISKHYNIDQEMIYANGLSNGGGMSFALSCMMRDRIAAVGLVGSAQTMPKPFDWCPDKRPVPMINFHGTDDTFARYHGGKSPVFAPGFPDITEFTRQWAERNRCEVVSADKAVAADVKVRRYSRCADNADVVFYTLVGGGHTWPGGGHLPEWFVGKTNRNVDASQTMWDFFKLHTLRVKR